MKIARPFAAALALAAALCGLPAHAAQGEQVASALGSARVGGLWCGAGLLEGFSLDIVQHAQDLSARLVRKTRVREITGHVEGTRVITDPQRNHTMELLAQGDELRIVAATGVLALAQGQYFTRAAGAYCTR